MSEEIKKPWCVYENVLGNAQGFGKIEEENKTSVKIKYSEKQNHRQEVWDPEYVKRFYTLEEAVEHYIGNRASGSFLDTHEPPEKIRKSAKQYFPSYFEKKKSN